MKAAAHSVEALVIGGGPAGTAAAIALARSGADVLLVERRAFPRSKVCGGCLGPRAMECLRQLGVDSGGITAARLDRVRVHVAGANAVLPLPGGLAVDRAELDHRLLASARASGVAVWTEARARIGEKHAMGRRVQVECRGDARAVTAKIVVLATGLPSVPATVPDARVGLSQSRAPTTTSSPAGGVPGAPSPSSPVWQERMGPPPGEVWMISGERGYLGMVRFADGRLNVAVSVAARALGSRSPGETVDQILVEAALAPLRWDEGWTGTPPLRARPAEAVEERVLPVGDAAGFWEPFTGEGIGWALEAGIAVAPVARELGRDWDHGRAAAWLGERHAWMRRVQRRSRTVAAISAHPRIARAALGLIRRVPAAGRWLIPTAAAVGAAGTTPDAARGAA